MTHINHFNEQRIACLSLHLKGASYLKYFRHPDFKNPTDFIQTGYNLYGNDFEKFFIDAKKILDIHAKDEIGMITLLDADYPFSLKNSLNPPLAIFYLGDIQLLRLKSISIVGTRKPSLITLPWLSRICDFLANNKFVLVSGLAIGVDSIVHSQGMQYGTIGVLPQSLDFRYPRIHDYLYQKARKQDRVLLLSEYPVSTSARKFHFVHRNRIISALSPWTIFAEGGTKSGAILTAKWCIKNRRKLYLLNHDLQRNNSGGNELTSCGEGLDITHYFPVQIHHSEFYRHINDPGFVYLGNNTYIFIDTSDFSLKFLSPDPPDPDFELYSG
ncbi:MAG: DNA-protecting protein DprA [Spirochaetia bacterium]|nr:DNA-protecting protein DprA [Spirochaetia bacterium]